MILADIPPVSMNFMRDGGNVSINKFHEECLAKWEFGDF